MGSAFDVVINIVTNLAYFLFGILVLGIIIGIIVWIIMRNKRFKQFKCIILEKDGFNMPHYTTDDAGIFVDRRTMNKLLFLKKGKAGLNPDAIPYISDDKGKKLIALKKIGQKNYRYINFDELFKDADKIEVGEEDVNWAINAYESQKAIFGSTLLTKLMPYIGLIIMGVLMIGMMAVLLQKIPGVITEMQELAKIMKDIAQMQTGSTIIK